MCSAIGCYLLFFPDIARLVIRSPNALFTRFGTSASYAGFIPLDSLPVVSAPNETEFSGLPQDFYVVKDGATDCSFVSAVMLLLRRDPHFLSRVIRKEANETYRVLYSLMDQPVSVTQKDLEEFQGFWKSTRNWYNRILSGHLPAILTVLRCAYYHFQADLGIRCCIGMVHSGGVPLHDLMILSGVVTGITVKASEEENTKRVNFRNCSSVIIETRWRNQKGFEAKVRDAGVHISNPIMLLNKPNEYLIILSSIYTIPWYLKHKFVPNHAYYFLGQNGPDRYVLGDSYHTRRPISVSGTELGAYFRAMDVISLSGIGEKSP